MPAIIASSSSFRSDNFIGRAFSSIKSAWFPCTYTLASTTVVSKSSKSARTKLLFFNKDFGYNWLLCDQLSAGVCYDVNKPIVPSKRIANFPGYRNVKNDTISSWLQAYIISPSHMTKLTLVSRNITLAVHVCLRSYAWIKHRRTIASLTCSAGAADARNRIDYFGNRNFV